MYRPGLQIKCREKDIYMQKKQLRRQELGAMTFKAGASTNMLLT